MIRLFFFRLCSHLPSPTSLAITFWPLHHVHHTTAQQSVPMIKSLPLPLLFLASPLSAPYSSPSQSPPHTPLHTKRQQSVPMMKSQPLPLLFLASPLSALHSSPSQSTPHFTPHHSSPIMPSPSPLSPLSPPSPLPLPLFLFASPLSPPSPSFRRDFASPSEYRQ
jgi:hypothetical protein